jgi:hypothetical protein
MKTPIIDLLVTIIDNYGDMGTACELITALRSGYGDQYGYVIWTNDVDRMSKFVRESGIGDIAIRDITMFCHMQKSAIMISILHTPLPDLDLIAPHALILRLDYISLDPLWLQYNETEHIASTPDRRIIEVIPSPLE